MRHVVSGLVVSALAASALVAVAGCGDARSHAAIPAASRFRGMAVVEPIAAPDFALRDQAGRLVRLAPPASRRSAFTIVTFLYTRCRDVCPVIADQLNLALRRLTAAGYSVRVLAVSVDPQGDTPAAVARFVRLHRLVPRFHYLRESATELRHVWHAYNVAADPGSTATAVDHSAFELLIDRSGHERVYYTSAIRAAAVVADVETLARA